jgi:monoamine oxidase
VLVGFVEGRAARELALATPEERRQAVIGCFARYFGPRAAAPERYIERVWADERWSRGCYGCYFPPGGWTEYGPALREPVGRVHWAGAETAAAWMGYMDGAVRSGERAAAEIIAAEPG